MKQIYISILTVLLSFLMFGCGSSKTSTTGGRTATTPYHHTQTGGQTIHLRYNKLGVNLDLNIVFPTTVKGDIYSYSGNVNIRGTIDATTANCLRGRRSFSCNAQINVANITANSCNINGHNIGLFIILKRGGEQLRAAYSIIGVKLYPDQACYQPN